MMFGPCMKTKTANFGSARETVSPATILLLCTAPVPKSFPFCERRNLWAHPQRMQFGAFCRIKREIFGSEPTKEPFATMESRLLIFYVMTVSSTTAVLRLKSVQSILEDKNGNIWFASWSREGVGRYDGKSLTSFKPNGDDMVHAILEDKNGNIWFGTRDHGVCRYDGKTFTNFTAEQGLGHSTVYSMLEDKAGNLWFATENGSGEEGEDGGLWRFDGKSFAKLTTKEGLRHNGVFSIVEDRVGNIWVGTRN